MSQATTPDSLAFEVAGTGSVSVVMLHGLGGDRQQTKAVLDESLLGAGRYVVPDLRAHGSTSLPFTAADLTFRRLAQDVEDTLALTRSAAPVVLVGISLGAAVACEMLARQRTKLLGLLLVRPAWAWQGSPANLAPLQSIGRLLEALPVDEARERFTASDDFARMDQQSPSAATAVLGQFDSPRAKERSARLRCLPADAPRRAESARHLPGAVIGGAADPLHPLSMAASVAIDLDLPMVEVSPRYDAPAVHQAQVGAALERLLEEVA
jgi:pimeloyl-ACP methyl ester carboxylesterase